MKHIKSISIIIPAYNEEQRLPKTLQSIIDFTKKEHSKDNLDYEIIVVDDGSKDKTRDVVEKFMKKNNHIRLNKKRVNKGKGYTVKEGMLMAKKEYAVFTDADNSTDMTELKKFDVFAKEYPIVIGIRTKKSIKKKQPIIRVLAGRTFSLLVAIISGITIGDTQCGFKLFNKKAIKKIFPYMKTNGWAFDIEVFMRAKKEKLEVKKVPVIWIDDERTKLKFFQDSIKMFKEIIKSRLIVKKEYMFGKHK